jgi:hypothetical protein
MESSKQTTIKEHEEGQIMSNETKAMQQDERSTRMQATDSNTYDETIEDTNNQSEKEGESLPLPDDVTMEPQDKEHMHLGLIKDSPSLVEVYLPVSDDAGEQLGDRELEKKVKEYCELYASKKMGAIDNPEDLLHELITLSITYSKKVNQSSAVTLGIDCKHRIRLGMLFNFQKMLVAEAREDWTDWFSKHYKASYLRSAQDYMALARVPNVIRYAFLGKERLLEIKRALPSANTEEDPVGAFFKDNNISFDPEREICINDFKQEIDALLALMKIKKVEHDRGIDIHAGEDMIKNLISMGVKVDNGLIHDLVIIKENGGDTNQYLERKFINGGAEDEIIVSAKKVRGFPKIVATLKDTVDYLKEHTELADQIDSSGITTMEEAISELKGLINR